MNDFEQMMRDPLSRRSFLARATAAGLGAVALTLLAGCGGSSSSASTIFDPTRLPGIPGRNENEAVLNFALTLEILEANLYLQALNKAAGRALTTPLDSTVPASQSLGNYTLSPSIGAGNVTSAPAAFLYLVQFAYVEATHRDFLIAVLQSLGAPQVSPNPNGYQFPGGSPGSDLGTILGSILPLEETGVRAYLGAGPLITDNNILQTAVSIYSTEARHSAAISYLLGKDPGPNPQAGDQLIDGLTAYPHPDTFEYFLSPTTVLNAAKSTYYK